MMKKILSITLAAAFSVSSVPAAFAVVNKDTSVGEIFTVEYGNELFEDKKLDSVKSSDESVVYIDENQKAYAVGTGEAVLSYEAEDGSEHKNSEITVRVEPKKLKAPEFAVFPKDSTEDKRAVISTPNLPSAEAVSGDDVYISAKDATAEFTDEKTQNGYKVKISGLKLLGSDSDKYILESDTKESEGRIIQKLDAEIIAEEIKGIYQPAGMHKLSLPDAPQGFGISVKSTSDGRVIAEDMCVMPHSEDKEVKLVLSVDELQNVEKPEEDIENEDSEVEEKPDTEEENQNSGSVEAEDAEKAEEDKEAVPSESADTKEFAVTVKGTDNAVISVIADEGGTASGGGSYKMGEKVTLLAAPDDGYYFSGWEVCNEVVSRDAQYSFDAERVMEINARFIKESERVIKVTAETDTTGKTVEGAGEYKFGDTVTLKTDSGLRYWSIGGKKVSEQNPYTFTATEDVTVKAHFTVSTGGGSLNNNFTYVTVKYVTGGGTAVKDASVIKGTAAKQPAAPVRKGYDFNGWFTDKELTKRFDFKNTRIFEDLTLYAGWKKSDATENKCPFTDVAEDAWYKAAVDFVYNNKLMLGVTDTEFSPEIKLTRAMLVTVLHRMSKEEAENKSFLTFDDVAEDAWYAAPVKWAVENKLAFGYDENTFAPDDYITREQLAVMLFRFMKYSGMDMGGAADISGYKDYSAVSDWAISAVKWAVDNKIISGMDNNLLLPQGSATRAQCAQILMKSAEGIEIMSEEE